MRNARPMAVALLAAFALWGPALATTHGDLGAWSKRAKAQVLRALKDPDSARLRNVFVSRWTVDGKDALALCGELNAKNGMGGYTGFRRFVADENGAVVENVLVWEDACARPIQRVP